MLVEKGAGSRLRGISNMIIRIVDRKEKPLKEVVP
jgi:hypothetical protein